MKELSEFWVVLLDYLGFINLSIAGLILVWHFYRLTSFENPVKKYEYANKSEVRLLKLATKFVALAAGFFFFDYASVALGMIQGFEFAFIAFVAVGITVMIGYSFTQYFEIYYPFIMEKKLTRIRFTPRKSPKTGKPMRLLTELEEDAHLTQEMIDNEDAFTHEYDVWLDEETGYKLIEEYDGHLHAQICPNCNFRTMKDYREDVVKSPSVSERGLVSKHYKCSNCGHEEDRDIPIASLNEEKEYNVLV